MTYCYSNRTGTKTVERIFPVGKAPAHVRVGCYRYYRDIVAEHSSNSRSRSGKKNWPMRPESLAVNPEDAAHATADAAKEGVPTYFDPKTGCPEIRNQKHYKQYCEAYGFYKRNAGYGDPVPQGR